MKLASHARYAFSPIRDRSHFLWPEGRTLAVYIGMNLECFTFGGGLGAELSPASPRPDVLNYSWRDYGNRVGVWRMIDLFDRLSIPCTVLANSFVYEEAPGVIEAFRERGDEIAGHGRTNAECQGILSENQELELIREATATLTCREGIAPKGWLGPWISQSLITPDLLQEEGYEYMLDWCHDEQPVWMKTRSGSEILSVPYPQELNDIPQIVGRKREGREFADMIIDAFDIMLDESKTRIKKSSSSAFPSRVMGIAVHSYIMGHPHRFKHLERALKYVVEHCGDTVWFTTAGAINDHYRQCCRSW